MRIVHVQMFVESAGIWSSGIRELCLFLYRVLPRGITHCTVGVPLHYLVLTHWLGIEEASKTSGMINIL